MSIPVHSAGRGVKAVGFLIILLGIPACLYIPGVGIVPIALGFFIFVAGRLMD